MKDENQIIVYGGTSMYYQAESGVVLGYPLLSF